MSLPVAADEPLRAAQYVRMSTDMQKYSIENQAAAIASYAARCNLDIVRTYVDLARSGLRIQNREGLSRLIDDVQNGHADFRFVLVYDVSRWGRFQDADESAYYEFVCKRAAIKVLYCAELFDNASDDLFTAVMKNIKRVMAGEYSRELSVKVYAGACRTARLGFKQGGTAGYGLQRVLVDEFRRPKCLLAPGHRKHLMSDRVIRQPGRPDEVRTIERVFRSFVIAKKTELTIARELNEEGILNEFGRPWRVPSIQRMLTCEKYIGNLVYNQKSGKFRRRRQPNPPDQWIRVNNAFEAVVDPELFERAQKIFARRPDRLVRLWPSNDEILARLRELREQRGHLSCVIIDNADGMPHSCIYRARFGSLRKAFELIGYDTRSCNSFDGRRAAVATVGRLQSELAAEIQRSGTYAEFVKPTTHRSRAIVTVNKSLTISVYIARCFRIPRGALRWYVRRHITRDADMILFIRMDQNNTGILDYYLMPSEKIVDGRISFWERSRAKLERYRSCDVTGLIAPIKTRLTTKAQRVRQNAGSDGKREVGE